MKVLLAPDSFKENISALDICSILSLAIGGVSTDFEVFQMPLSDGGDGFVAVLKHYLNFETQTVKAHDALMHPINAEFLFDAQNKTAFIESAEAIGLHLLKTKEQNPMHTTSYGLGELIKAALDLNANNLIVGLGGTATNDAGMGMLKALGVEFFDVNGNKLAPFGNQLQQIHSIDSSQLDKRIFAVQITAACDVENPFCGKQGAAFVFAAQKGANAHEIELLDAGLLHFAVLAKKKFSFDFQTLKGGGAAGGVAASMAAVLGAKLNSGFQVLSQIINLEQWIAKSDLIVSAEGKIDSQTASGKVIGSLLATCNKHNKKLIVFTANIGDSIENLYEKGLTSVFSIQNAPMSKAESYTNAKELLLKSATNVFRLLAQTNNLQ